MSEATLLYLNMLINKLPKPAIFKLSLLTSIVFEGYSDALINQIINHNISFNAGDWMLKLYPFYPDIKKKRQQPIYQIYSSNFVLAIAFVQKNIDERKAWANRRTFTFDYNSFAELSTLTVNSNKSLVFNLTTENKYSGLLKTKTLRLVDNAVSQKIDIELRQKESPKEQKGKKASKEQVSQLSMGMSYQEYRIMNLLIKKSLFELGGWKIMFDAQKKTQIDELDVIEKNKIEMDKIFAI